MQTRIEELKKKGWVNLSSEERTEYSSLKGEKPKKNVQIVKETEKAFVGEVVSQYTFSTRTKFRGQYYEKGDHVPECSPEDMTMLLNSNLIKI